jgi:hypothetical protein
MKLSMSARQRSLAQLRGWTGSFGNRKCCAALLAVLAHAAKQFGTSVKLVTPVANASGKVPVRKFRCSFEKICGEVHFFLACECRDCILRKRPCFAVF